MFICPNLDNDLVPHPAIRRQSQLNPSPVDGLLCLREIVAMDGGQEKHHTVPGKTN